jgi:hypothetical protein
MKDAAKMLGISYKGCYIRCGNSTWTPAAASNHRGAGKNRQCRRFDGIGLFANSTRFDKRVHLKHTHSRLVARAGFGVISNELIGL